MMKRAIARAQ